MKKALFIISIFFALSLALFSSEIVIPEEDEPKKEITILQPDEDIANENLTIENGTAQFFWDDNIIKAEGPVKKGQKMVNGKSTLKMKMLRS